MKKNIIFNVAIVLLSLVFVFSAFMLIKGIVVGEKEQNEFEELSVLIETVPEKPEVEGPKEEGEKETQKKPQKRNLSAVMKQNEDCIGWIYVEGSIINYPVMYTKTVPQKYLHLNFSGKKSKAGTPFLDYRCEGDVTNKILYGHNMKNGTMFHQLKRYRTKSYYNSHPYIEYETKEGLEKYKIFAVANVVSNDRWYSFVNAKDEKQYNEFIKNLKSKDLYETGITPKYPEKLITLSTCSGENRLIVVGVLEE